MVEIVSMDKNGRVVIPGKIRKRYQSRRFALEADENSIHLTPIKPLESLLGAVPDLDLKKIYQEHEEEED